MSLNTSNKSSTGILYIHVCLQIILIYHLFNNYVFFRNMLSDVSLSITSAGDVGGISGVSIIYLAFI